MTSRLADERLWAEALNLGAWDVLAKPFDTNEVIRTVSIAGQHWRDRHGVYSGLTQQRKSAGGTEYMAATGSVARGEKNGRNYLTDDELKHLETRFGPVVRQMGPWNSHGVFGYAGVPIIAVEKAAESIENPNLLIALPRLRTPDGRERSSIVGGFRPGLGRRR